MSLVTQSARIALQSTSTTTAQVSIKVGARRGSLVRSYYSVAENRQVQVPSKQSTVLRRQSLSIPPSIDGISYTPARRQSLSIPSSIERVNYIPPAISELNSESLFTPKLYPREIVFLGGAPGSGKGTNSSYISRLRNYSAPTIVVSDLLNTPACKLLKDNGVMINDDFVFQTLMAELQKPIYRDGVVVDGFPRTEVQVDYINKFHQDQAASSLFSTKPHLLFVMLHVDETESIARQQERGQKIQRQNEANELAGKKDCMVEVRLTDLTTTAAKARYDVFKEQFEAVMSLGNKFPLVVVDASMDPDSVKVNISNQMKLLPSSSVLL